MTTLVAASVEENGGRTSRHNGREQESREGKGGTSSTGCRQTRKRTSQLFRAVEKFSSSKVPQCVSCIQQSNAELDRKIMFRIRTVLTCHLEKLEKLLRRRGRNAS